MTNKNYQRTAEEQEKAAERRLAREQRIHAEIQAERAAAFYNVLVQGRSIGVVALEGARVDYFLDGLQTEHEKNGGSVLRLDACGTIQGSDLGYGHAERTLQQISEHRRAFGPKGAIAFLGFKFTDNETIGSPVVTKVLGERIERQNNTKPHLDKDPSTVLIGDGSVTDLQAHPYYSLRDQSQHPIGKLVVPRLGLNAHNELVTNTVFGLPMEELQALEPIYLPPVLARQRHLGGR